MSKSAGCCGDGPRPGRYPDLIVHTGPREFSIAKIILLGDESTGKSCLVEKLTKNVFREEEKPTVG